MLGEVAAYPVAKELELAFALAHGPRARGQHVVPTGFFWKGASSNGGGDDGCLRVLCHRPLVHAALPVRALEVHDASCSAQILPQQSKRAAIAVDGGVHKDPADQHSMQAHGV